MGGEQLIAANQEVARKLNVGFPPHEDVSQTAYLNEEYIHTEEKVPVAETPNFNRNETESYLTQSLRRTRLVHAAAVLCSAVALGNALGSEPASANQKSPSKEARALSSAEISPLKANSSGITEQNIESSKTTINIARSKSSEKSFSRASVRANARSVSRAKIKQALRNDRCRDYSSQQAMRRGIRTQGYNGSGTGYAPENRFTTLCWVKLNNGWELVRAQCGNKAKIARPVIERAKQIIWVNNWNKAKLWVKTKAHAKAIAECRTDNTYAFAEGNGYGRSWARIGLRAALNANGKKLKKTITKVKGEASGEAYAGAKADATANCEESTEQSVSIETITEKHREKPKKENFPPTTDITAPEHMFESGTAEICERENDPNGLGDIVSRNFTKTRGSFISSIYKRDEPGEYCIMYRAPSTPGDTTVGSEVIDSKNNTDSDFATFPILKDNF